MTFNYCINPATVIGIPDTGARENAMPLEIAEALGLDVKAPDDRIFRQIGGKRFHSCGIIQARCDFGKTLGCDPKELDCKFYVFDGLDCLLLCNDFIKETETLTIYRHRLMQRWVPPASVLSVRSLGDSREILLCTLDGKDTEALPDSGSDIDVISYEYARRRGFILEKNEQWVKFADGSMTQACGIYTAQLVIGLGGQKFHFDTEQDRGDGLEDLLPSHRLMNDIAPQAENKQYRRVIQTKFYVLENIQVDVIIGMSSLESLRVYTQHRESLVSQPIQDIGTAPLDRIILLSKIERKIRQFSHRWLTNSQKETLSESKWLKGIKLREMLIFSRNSFNRTNFERSGPGRELATGSCER